MKKLICVLVAVMVMLAVACPALAEEATPSVKYEAAPNFKNLVDENGNELGVGAIYDAEGKVVGYVSVSDLKITSYADSDLIKELAAKIASGEAGIDSKLNVIELFDISWADESKLAEGQTLQLTFELGVEKDVEVTVMTYNETTQVWEPIAKVVNNGDGTVTCTFEHFCVVAMAVNADNGNNGGNNNEPTTPATTAPAGEEPGESKSSSAWIWIVVGVIAVAGAGAAFYFLYYDKKSVQ